MNVAMNVVGSLRGVNPSGCMLYAWFDLTCRLMMRNTIHNVELCIWIVCFDMHVVDEADNSYC